MKLHKPRVMLFAYDGTGLGHLMRLIRIAECLKKDFNPLVVTGHRAVCQIIPEDIEFIRLPVFGPAATEQLGMKGHSLNIKEFRSDSLVHIVKLFKPHILITDYMPAGKKNELLPIITMCPCLKYLIMRGDIGSQEQINNVIFTPENNLLIEQYYNRVFIASDPLFEDFSSDTSIPIAVRAKFQHVGYVTRTISVEEIMDMRDRQGLVRSGKWVVCSAGGGRMGEDLIRKCLEIAQDERYEDVKFDIVRGYYSELPWPNDIYDTINLGKNVRYSRSSTSLPVMHSAADVVICSGGYNTLLETVQGQGKHILAYSVQIGENEQIRNIQNFQKYYPVRMISNLDTLPEELDHCLHSPVLSPAMNMDMDGAQRIADSIKEDFFYVEHI